MSAPSPQLAGGEDLVLRARLHPMVFSGAVSFAASVIGIVALIIYRNDLPPETVRQMWLVGAGLAACGFVAPYLRWRAAEFVLTTRRLLVCAGLLRVHTAEMPLARITAVDVSRSLVGRLLGYGTLRLAGPHGTEVFPRVAGPEELRDAILRQLPRSAGARGR